MAAGKTSVGRAVAAARGRRFVDLDDDIAALGEPVATLVARDEPEFRRREALALRAALAATDDPVIATGGGAAAHADNLDAMRAAGLVVALAVDPGEATRRAAGDAQVRPLLADAVALAARRAPIYRRAHAVVDTMGRTVAEVAAQVAAVEATWSALPAGRRDATVLALGARSYPVVVSEQLAADDTAVLRAALAGATQLAVITDDNVGPAWAPPVLASLRAAGLQEPAVISLPPGEPTKSLAQYQALCEQLIAHGCDRGSALIALGGGVIGDLTGFVAATLFRGIPVVQLPTTIVAMTDAAIGGKTAIDLPAGKNLVGAFWQPRLVLCSLATLATLPASERRAGFGELWKYALLDGPALWREVAACAAWAAGAAGEGAPPPPALRSVIARAIAYKADVVGRDERERTGVRALLNLGHTVGHAIESASGMTHGAAVGLGLLAACRVSTAVAGAPPGLEAEVAAALAATGLDHDLDRWLTDDVLARLAVDKKRHGGAIRFVVVTAPGACGIAEVSVTELGRILRRTPAA